MKGKGYTLFCFYATSLFPLFFLLSLSFLLSQWLLVYINLLARDCEYTLPRSYAHLHTFARVDHHPLSLLSFTPPTTTKHTHTHKHKDDVFFGFYPFSQKTHLLFYISLDPISKVDVFIYVQEFSQAMFFLENL